MCFIYGFYQTKDYRDLSIKVSQPFDELYCTIQLQNRDQECVVLVFVSVFWHYKT